MHTYGIYLAYICCSEMKANLYALQYRQILLIQLHLDCCKWLSNYIKTLINQNIQCHTSKLFIQN